MQGKQTECWCTTAAGKGRRPSRWLWSLTAGASLIWGQAMDQVRDVAFRAAVDGAEQRYALLEPRGYDPAAPHDLLIALHGHGSDRWQFMQPTRDETRAALDIAAKYGMIYAAPDYRAKTSWMGPKAEADVEHIIGKLKRESKIGKVFLCGASMGGASALTFTALHPELVDGVVAMNGTANHLEYENFQDAIQTSFGGSKRAIPLEYKKRSAEYWPERFTMPVALTACGQDKSVPPDSVLRLAGVLKNMQRHVLLIYREQEGHATRYADAVEALEYVIRLARATAGRQPIPATSGMREQLRLSTLFQNFAHVFFGP